MVIRAGVIAVVVVAAAISLYAQEQVPAPDVTYRTPRMHCKGEGRFGRCWVTNFGKEWRLRWILFTEPKQLAEGQEWVFEVPKSHNWILIELAITDSDHDTQRLRMSVKLIQDVAVFNKWTGDSH